MRKESKMAFQKVSATHKKTRIKRALARQL